MERVERHPKILYLDILVSRIIYRGKPEVTYIPPEVVTFGYTVTLLYMVVTSYR